MTVTDPTPPQPSRDRLHWITTGLLALAFLSYVVHEHPALRADRETALAMDAAEFVTTALTAQITAFEQVVLACIGTWPPCRPTNAPNSKTPAPSCAEPEPERPAPSCP
jgi:hypothetical protein